MNTSEAEDRDNRRCTDEGITIVALDRAGRGLHRARPEQSRPHPWHSIPASQRRWLPLLAITVVAVAVVASQLL
ncbi:MAG: hypothetical protein K0V04_17160 [Deltaproteobacteria bacterium]|nr:hypothetical protein [Deltaproteobacteria bacterium]